jgi:hypothetical protein
MLNSWSKLWNEDNKKKKSMLKDSWFSHEIEIIFKKKIKKLLKRKLKKQGLILKIPSLLVCFFLLVNVNRK